MNKIKLKFIRLSIELERIKKRIREYEKLQRETIHEIEHLDLTEWWDTSVCIHSKECEAVSARQCIGFCDIPEELWKAEKRDLIKDFEIEL